MALFASYLVGRYGRHGTLWAERPTVPRLPIHSWQVWNEPNLWPWWPPIADAAAYVRLLADVGRGIKRCDQAAEVVAAGLPNSHAWLGPQVAEYLDAMYRAGARGTFDSLAIHPYGSETWRVVDQLREARAVASRYGDPAPIWVTELGWGTGGPPTSITVSEARQADLLRATLAELHARREEIGIRGFVYYQWIDLWAGGSNADSLWHHIGLLRADGTAKPALAAYLNTIGGLGLAPAQETDSGAAVAGCAPPPAALTGGSATGAPGGSGAGPGHAAPGSGGASRAGACRRTVRQPCSPRLSGVSLRPARFRPAASGPPLRPGALCGPASGCGRAGARLAFRSSAGTVELHLWRGRGRRARPLGSVLRLRARGGSTELRLLGRLRGRPLARGEYRATLQVVDGEGHRSKLVSRRFQIVG
jgi:hypothetical protein